MDDPPALGEIAEDQREQSTRAFPVGHRELPAPSRQHRAGAEYDLLEAREGETAHLAPLGLVDPAIARAQRLEAVESIRARLEDDRRTTLIAVEEAVEILAVPALDLRVE